MGKVLNQLIQLEKQAIDSGFGWPTVDMALDQLLSEAQEVQQAIADNEPLARVQEEIGDLFHACIGLCLFMKFDVAETLANATHKFEKRFLATQEIAKQKGYPSLKGQPMEILLQWWELAKQQTDKA